MTDWMHVLRLLRPAPHAFVLSSAFYLVFASPTQAQYYTDTGNPANPPWSAIKPTLNDGTADPGPVSGSVINVNNALTEAGLYGDRPISAGPLRIHIPCNTSTKGLTNFTRWYQTDGNTQVFRLFVNDENTANSRVGAARSEAFTETNWNATDNLTYEWSGHYTIAHRQQGAAIFQVKNTDNDWAVQLNLLGNGALVVNNRRNASDVTVKNPDGTIKNFDGQGFDVRIQDDGYNYKVWIDGDLLADNFYARPTGGTQFRWGIYLGSTILNPPSDYSLITVSGAEVLTWTGDIGTPITIVTKANNNAQDLSVGDSWAPGTAPGLYEIAQWNSSVNSNNCNTTLKIDQVWSGIKITSPATAVTLSGTSTLGLDRSGVDMSAAWRNLVVNCPVELRETAPWNISARTSATFNNSLSGYGGMTLGGSGTVVLTGANTFTGPIAINNGTLRLGNGGTTGSLSPDSTITVGSGATFQIHQSDNVAQGTHFSSAAIVGAGGLRKSGTGKLTLTAANAYTGPTTISAGTLEAANGNALAATTVTVDTAATLAIASGSTMRSPAVIVDGGTLSAQAVAVNNTTGITSLAINAGTLAGSPTVTIGAGGEMSLAQDARVAVAVGGLAMDETGAGGRLDLGAGQVTIAAGGITAADVRAYIIAGRNNGAWNGTTGIMSSTAASSGGTRAVGYVVAGDGSATVTYSAAGDVDLSGQVNVFDLVSINSSGKYGTGTSAVWSQGDFNYDSVTDVFDLVGINTAAVYGQGNYFPAAPTAGSLGGPAAVPEPTSWLLVASGLAGLAVARRRRAA
jgi:autotransporter-associated beta strand protein